MTGLIIWLLFVAALSIWLARRSKWRRENWEDQDHGRWFLTWSCHICLEDRPDANISVYSFPIKGLPNCLRNVRYCNDRPSCLAGARDLNLKQKGGDISADL